MIGNYYRCICLAAFSVRCVWVGGRKSTTTTTTSNNFNFQFGISSWHDKHHHQHREGEDDPSTMHINIIQNTFRRVVMGCPWGPRRHKFIYYYLIFAVTLHFSNCNILTTQLNRPHWSHSGLVQHAVESHWGSPPASQSHPSRDEWEWGLLYLAHTQFIKCTGPVWVGAEVQ